jgi:hypothetical protein
LAASTVPRRRCIANSAITPAEADVGGSARHDGGLSAVASNEILLGMNGSRGTTLSHSVAIGIVMAHG